VESTAFSPDWKWLACGSAGGAQGGWIGWWDVGSSKFLRWSELPGRLRQDGKAIIRPAVNALAFSSDGRLLASGDWDHVVRLWDVGTGNEVARFLGHKGSVVGVAFSPDGRTLASSSADQTVLLWKIPQRKP
jgi:WD40 repeat protein